MQPFEIEGELQERSESDPTRVVIKLVPYGVTAKTPIGRERFARGAFAGTDITKVHLESQRHNGDIVGIGEALEERDDGAYGVFRVADTSAGRDLLKLVAEKVLTAASVSFAGVKDSLAPDGALQRDQVDLRRVAILPRGAYQSAGVVAMREDVSDDMATTEVAAYDDKPLMERMDSVDEAIARVNAQLLDTGSGEPADEIRSWDDAWTLYQTDPEKAETLFQRALADNTYALNTGLQGGANIARIIEPVAAKRRTINALGLQGLPAKGMSVDFIRFDEASTGYEALVDEQSAEKAEINSGTHIWEPATAPVKVYAGGADNSWQLLERSEPSFRELLLRQYASEWAFKTNAVMVASVSAGFTADTLTLGADTSALIAKLIDQSIAIEGLVDSPASVVLCASDVWAAIAKLPDLLPPNYGTVNLPGTMSAGSLNVNISGLSIQHEPMLAAGKMITSVGGSEAAAFHELFRGIITQDQVAHLGTDIAIWGYGAPVIYRAAAGFVTTVTLA